MANFIGLLFGLVFTILMGPGLICGWIGDKISGDTGYKGSGALGLAIIISLAFWAIALAVGVAFLLPW